MPAPPPTRPPAPAPSRSTRRLPTSSATPSTPPNLFSLAETGNIYTRIMNPTQAVVEERLAALEGGIAAVAVASGQAAETLDLLNLAGAGDHIVSSASLYGGTYNLLQIHPRPAGHEVTFVDPDDLDAWRAAVRPTHEALLRGRPSPTPATTSWTSSHRSHRP